MLRLLLSASALLCVAASSATIEFKDGRRYHSSLLSEDQFAYVLLIDGARVQIPKSMVASYSEEAPAAASAPVEEGAIRALPDIAAGGPALIRGEAYAPPPAPLQEPVAFEVTAEGLERRQEDGSAAPTQLSVAELQHLRSAVDALSFEHSAEQRTQARASLQEAGDPGLAVLAEYGLYHELPSVRTNAADLLGDLGGQRVLKPLIEAFYAAAVPTIPPYNRSYVQALARQISSLSGVLYTFPVRATTSTPRIAEEMVNWWRLNFDRLPPQLGEPALDATDPAYYANLTGLRTLTLEKRQFAGSNIPSDLVPMIPTVNSPAEEAWLQTFPTVPEQTGMSEQFPVSFTPQVIKVPSPERDSPGMWRQQYFAERLRNEAEARGAPRY